MPERSEDFVAGWRMLQDHRWPESVAGTMTAVARAALEYGAGSAASSGYNDDDEWLFTCAVCLIGHDVVGHFVDIAKGEQSWGIRSQASLTRSEVNDGI